MMNNNETKNYQMELSNEIKKTNSKITKLLNKYKMTSKDKVTIWELLNLSFDYELEVEKLCGE